jgi:hypothetical protein
MVFVMRDYWTSQTYALTLTVLVPYPDVQRIEPSSIVLEVENHRFPIIHHLKQLRRNTVRPFLHDSQEPFEHELLP